MDARIAVKKVAKYASSASGDTLEMVERPGGGLSFVLSDGQRSGRSAKAISNIVARKAISLLAEGVRDGAAARAASDYLYTHRSGKVLATLNILSIDLASQTMVLSRNNPAPVFVVRGGELLELGGDSPPVGTRRGIRPSIDEIPLAQGLTAVVFTDGLIHAGDRTGNRLDVQASVQQLIDHGAPDAERWAELLLEQALELDQGRPIDDISVLVAAVSENDDGNVRHLSVRLPL